MHDDINNNLPKHVGSNDYFFTVIQVPDWEIARNCGKFLHKGWIYRGQSESSWNLSSTIERSARRQGYGSLQLLHDSEKFMVEQFIRRAHNFLHDPPRPEKRLEWLSLIQHYGGPTRLLDFTRSFYVASYFAVENATSDFAVWAVNASKLENHFKDISKIDRNVRQLEFRTRLENAMDKCIGKNNLKKLVLPIEPYRINERLSAQQGLFLTQTDISSSFIDNIVGSFGVSPDIFDAAKGIEVKKLEELQMLQMQNALGIFIKIVVSGKCRKAALSDLRDMNINAATLFPGLDGFARSFHFYFSVFQSLDG